MMEVNSSSLICYSIHSSNRFWRSHPHSSSKLVWDLLCFLFHSGPSLFKCPQFLIFSSLETFTPPTSYHYVPFVYSGRTFSKSYSVRGLTMFRNKRPTFTPWNLLQGQEHNVRFLFLFVLTLPYIDFMSLLNSSINLLVY